MGSIAQNDEIARSAEAVYLRSGGIVEIRAFGEKGGWPKTYSGWFDTKEDFVDAAATLEQQEFEVYATLNPCSDGLLARACNKLAAGKKTGATTDEDIVRRVWVPVDLDPERESGISATDEEKAAAHALALEIRAYLADRGIMSLLADSGNGYHLLIPVDLPNTPSTLALVGAFLRALDARFSNDAVHVDTGVQNAARIMKIYGTTARKGESVERIGRVHRRSAVLDVPEELEPVEKDALAKIAGEAPTTQAARSKTDGDEWLDKWLEAHPDVPTKGDWKPWQGTGRMIGLEHCPWNNHTDGAPFLGQLPDGAITARCHHNSCDYNWHDFREFYDPKSERTSEPTEDGREAKQGNQAQRLIGYAMEAVGELFLDQNGTEHALIDGAPVPLSSGCYGWLRRLFWEHEEAAAATELLGTVAGQLRAFAEVSSNTHTLYLRAAQHEDAVYLYLGPGRVVRVDADGWALDDNPPVMFRRVANLKELPDPKRGGSLDLLDAFITAQEDRDHRLAKTWLVSALLADVPRPILLAHGPQGSTKSSVQRVLKNIIDPARPESLKLREKDFEQNINKAFVPFFDNISTISDYMADELSKAVTGAGNAVRKLYEDDEDVIREYKRAMLLNGLVIPTEKADLIDRVLPVALKRVPKEERETERRMQALFEERHPKLLGAVLDALSGALRHHKEVRGLPRLADWAEYAIALYKYLEWDGYRGFMSDWAVIEEGQHETTLEASVLAQCVVALMREHNEVDESPSKMMDLLKNAAASERIDTDVKGSDFPASASWLLRKLVPVVPTLESFRITVEDGVRGRGKDKTRYVRFAYGNSIPPDGNSKTKMLSDQKPHRNGLGTAGDSRTAYFPENRKHTEERIDKGTVLQGGKYAVPRGDAVPTAYLSGKTPDSISGDAVPTSGDAVPAARFGLNEQNGSPRAMTDEERAQMEAWVAAKGAKMPRRHDNAGKIKWRKKPKKRKSTRRDYNHKAHRTGIKSVDNL
jgi:hypothetical protein